MLRTTRGRARSPLGTIKWLAGLHPHPHLQRRRGVQIPGGWSLIVAHNGAGGCARSVHTILEKADPGLPGAHPVGQV